MSPIADRLVELRRHLEHLKTLQPRVHGAADLGRDLTLHNDVLFSLLMVCQAVIDVAAELSTRRGEKFEDFRGAIRNLALDTGYSPRSSGRSRDCPASATSSCTTTPTSTWIAWWRHSTISRRSSAS